MKYFVIPFLLLLTACTTTESNPTLIRERPVAITVPSELFNCPAVGRLPRVSTLTEIEVARTLVRLHSNNETCRSSILAIQSYIKAAEERINSGLR